MVSDRVLLILTPTTLEVNPLSTLRIMYNVRILKLELLKVRLGCPIPGRIGCEEEVHLLEGALVGFWVEGPYDGDGEDVCDPEEVVGLLPDVFECHGEEKSLFPAPSV